MIHIKLYEEINNRYEIGDYVIIENENSKFEIAPYKNYGIIKSRFIGQKSYIETYYYDIDYLDSIEFIIKNNEMYYIAHDEIKRLMTNKEIEEFNIIQNTKKYNL